MVISLNYRSDVKFEAVDATVESGFKAGLNERSPALVQEDDSNNTIGNNTGLVPERYAVIQSQRTLVYWYVGEVGEAMEKSEFAEAQEDLGFLAEQATDDDQQ